MPKLTHSDLLQLASLLDYFDITQRGLCHGFSGMLMQAALARDEKTFFERLDFLTTYKNNFEQLKKEIEEEKERIKKKLPPRKPIQHALIPFFEGTKLYQSPSSHQDVFGNRYIPQTNINATYSLISPKEEEKSVSILLDKSYALDKAGLTSYVIELESLLKQIRNTFLPILLGSSNHTVYLRYNNKIDKWLYVDINDFIRYPNNPSYFRELTNKELVDSIFTSFNIVGNTSFSLVDGNLTWFRKEESPYVIFCTQVFTNVSELDVLKKLNKSFKEFDKKHPVQTKQIEMYDCNTVGLLYAACENGHLEIVKEVLKQQPTYKNINQETKDTGDTPLSIACFYGYSEIVKELLKQNNIDVNKEDKNGDTPLYLACLNRHSEIAKELLKQNNIDINKTGKKKISPFYVACQTGLLDIVRLMIQSQKFQDINAIGIDNHTPLQVACLSTKYTQKNVNLFQLLLENGASLTHKNTAGETALDIALEKNNHAAISELLKYIILNKLPSESTMSSSSLEKAIRWSKEENLLDIVSHLEQKQQANTTSFVNAPLSLFTSENNDKEESKETLTPPSSNTPDL
ncbi:MAG: ankyrin repeat domain-containing protein [Gammaproteobacteria bacterium]|nr:ankyrin repeat domain-containing protein [Gammaproteobacteria bacterium]MCW5583795.1 ankyrin repeat domain-containing protein [Gammaproteobacteria bacterium]